MGLEHLSGYVVVLVVSGVVDIAAALSVWRRPGRVGRGSLCAVLLAAAAWCVAYALELVASGDSRVLWGALKFIGTTILPPAWLIFALQYTGRLTRPRRRLLAALAVEPALILLLLAYAPTRSLVRSYPAEQLQATLPTVHLGVAYWVHFVYTSTLVLAASAILLLTVMRMSRPLTSAIQLRANDRTAAFDALYTEREKPLIDAIEPVRITEEPLTSSGSAFWTANSRPRTLVLNVLSKCSSVISPNVPNS